MSKLIVLCALFAAAVAKPGLLPPLVPAPTYFTNFAPPLATSVHVQQSSYVSPASGITSIYPHLIKKRSPQFFYNSYAPYYSSYLSPSTYYDYPLTASYYSSLYPGYAAPAHFIKKRSAPLLTSSYIAPALTTSYSAAPLATTYSSSYIPSLPYYSPFYSNYLPTLPLIKK